MKIIGDIKIFNFFSSQNSSLSLINIIQCIFYIYRNKIDKKRKHFNGLDKKYSTLIGFCKEIDEHNSKNVMGELEVLKISLESLIDEKSNNSSNMKNETDNINQIKDEISNQKVSD